MKRIEAQRKYMKLSGAKRLALMIMLGVENSLRDGVAYEACISHIQGVE